MELKKKFGFWTGVALVIGIVIGSGIFFKADDILIATGGSVKLAILAFLVGALAMIFGALTFVEIAKDIPNSNGLNDYSKNSFGKAGEFISQLVGWFMAVLYFPIFMAALPIIASMYTHSLLNIDFTYFSLVALGLIYLFSLFILNMLAPLISSKFQISTTFIKLIPLVGVAVVGIVAGIINGNTLDALSSTSESFGRESNFFSAVVLVAFTYEGWILATNISSELENQEKNINKILIAGPLVILIIYVVYFLGLTSSAPVESFLENGDDATVQAIKNLFGDIAGSVLTAFIIISVLGALNGIILSGTKAFYLMGKDGKGLLPSKTAYVWEKTDYPIVGALFSLAIAVPMLFIWALNLTSDSFTYWFDETPVFILQILYISIFVSFIIKKTDRSFIKRFVVPTLAIVGALIIAYGGAIKETIFIDLLVCTIVFAVYVPIYLINKTK